MNNEEPRHTIPYVPDDVKQQFISCSLRVKYMNEQRVDELELEQKRAQALKREPSFEHNNRVYCFEDLIQLPKLELMQMKLEIEANLAAIKGQLSVAKSQAYIDGSYADAEWFRRAESASRHNGRGISLICAAMCHQKSVKTTALNREYAAAQIEAKENDNAKKNELEKRFVNAAKVILTEETFRRILALAKETQLEQ